MSGLVLLKLPSTERERSGALRGGYITGITLDSGASLHTRLLLFLAAVRGRVSCSVFWVDAIFALCPVLILVVAVRGQTTQNGASRQLVPEETVRWNDEDCCGPDALLSGQGSRVRAHTITWEQRWRRAVSQALVGAARAALSYWSSAPERVATQRCSWWKKSIGPLKIQQDCWGNCLQTHLAAHFLQQPRVKMVLVTVLMIGSRFATAAATLVQTFGFAPLPSSGICKGLCLFKEYKCMLALHVFHFGFSFLYFLTGRCFFEL